MNCQEHVLPVSRDMLVAEYTAAECRYIAAVMLRKAIETVSFAGGPASGFRRARATEQEANADLVRAREACEARGIPVNSSPILSLL